MAQHECVGFLTIGFCDICHLLECLRLRDANRCFITLEFGEKVLDGLIAPSRCCSAVTSGPTFKSCCFFVEFLGFCKVCGPCVRMYLFDSAAVRVPARKKLSTEL